MRYQQYKTSFSQTWEGRLFIYEDKTQNDRPWHKDAFVLLSREGENMGHMNGDYYTSKVGYVIENRVFRDMERAKRYMMKTCYMTERESTTYLSRLRMAFQQRLQAAGN